jgi:hypothetical protein
MSITWDSTVVKFDSTLVTFDSEDPRRYFVGTGNRNLSDTANWSLTSGGAGGASVPTSAINAIFDSNSGTGTLTMNALFQCKDFIATGISALTIAGSVYEMHVYGSFAGHTNLTCTFTGTSYFRSKGTGTITQNGATLNWNRWYIDGTGITTTLAANLTIGATPIHSVNGTLDIAGYTLTTTGTFNTAIGTKTLTLGAGTLKCTAWQNTVPTGFTFNKNTGTVEIITSAVSTFTGTDTFYNLTLSGGANIASALSFASNITVSNIFTITGSNTTNYRLLVASNAIGTPRRITVLGSVVASNVDFRDIVLTPYSLTQGELDNLIIDIANTTTANNGTLTLTGNLPAPSATSASARANLTSRGWTQTYNT